MDIVISASFGVNLGNEEEGIEKIIQKDMQGKISGGGYIWKGNLQTPIRINASKTDGTLIGSMALSPEPLVYEDEKVNSLYIAGTIVDPEFQKMGISREMFGYAHEHAKGHDTFHSFVGETNEKSLDSRKAMGFKVEEEGTFRACFFRVDPDIATKTLDEMKPRVVRLVRKSELVMTR